MVTMVYSRLCVTTIKTNILTLKFSPFGTCTKVCSILLEDFCDLKYAHTFFKCYSILKVGEFINILFKKYT